jgi:crotonobetainyl-CoA:carnitine CoA-transferase CaiB-like acyl-CoA transferase
VRPERVDEADECVDTRPGRRVRQDRGQTDVDGRSVMAQGPLAGVRIVECSMLGPAAITTALADLGADVVKVEPPGGDYIRAMTWPIVEGVSLMHLHLNRGKRSITLDLRSDSGKEVFRTLAATADVVVEAMRPGALDRLGLGATELRAERPGLVFASISGYGATGPYRDYPSHGIAYDTWAGIVAPEVDDEGFAYLPEHVSVGINAAPLYGALAILAAVIRARGSGVGADLELAQSDCAAAFDWYRSETWRAYERPETEVTGNPSDGYERRAPGTAGMREGVRYQVYASSDGYVLFMASEQVFWKNFCDAVERGDLYDRWPGSTYADHARGNRALHEELRAIFVTRSSAEWLELGGRVNTPIAAVNTPETLPADPQFADRFEWLPASALGADQLGFPVKFAGEPLPRPERAPTPGEHTEDVLRTVCGYDDAAIRRLGDAGAFG